MSTWISKKFEPTSFPAGALKLCHDRIAEALLVEPDVTITATYAEQDGSRTQKSLTPDAFGAITEVNLSPASIDFSYMGTLKSDGDKVHLYGVLCAEDNELKLSLLGPMPTVKELFEFIVKTLSLQELSPTVQTDLNAVESLLTAIEATGDEISLGQALRASKLLSVGTWQTLIGCAIALVVLGAVIPGSFAAYKIEQAQAKVQKTLVEMAGVENENERLQYENERLVVERDSRSEPQRGTAPLDASPVKLKSGDEQEAGTLGTPVKVRSGDEQKAATGEPSL